jgi:hypothetical protein
MNERVHAAMGAGVLCLLGAAHAVRAEIVGVTSSGFEVHETVHVAASQDKAYAALLTPARWWSSDHTFSQTLPDGGSVQHMTVLFLAPGKLLRLRGALGPLQALAVDGVMTWSFKAAAGGSDITVSYAVAGYSAQGFDMLSKAVDQVMAEQIGRLKKLLDV